MKKTWLFILLIAVSVSVLQAQDTTRIYKIAFFTPLFLDSAFDHNDEYRFSKNVFPKFINPGIEFYEGAQLALDSLNKEKAQLEIFIYDSKSNQQPLGELLESREMDDIDLIIAYTSSQEVKLFADAGLKRNIPVINANLPNDGGITGNPYLVILNPTLRTQCEGIYKYVQKYHSQTPVVVFRKKGQLEDRIKMHFEDYAATVAGSRLKMKFVDLSDSFSVHSLKQHLDTAYQTICIAGSLDETFGKRLAQQLASLKKQKYMVSVIGMPTWDGIKDFSKSEYKGLDIIYATPFYNPKVDKQSQAITAQFNKVMQARPTDMVFRGYEVMLRYGRLLKLYGNDLASNLASKPGKIFTDFDIQPVINKQGMTLDYFENKKLYFLKWQDGALKGVY